MTSSSLRSFVIVLGATPEAFLKSALLIFLSTSNFHKRLYEKLISGWVASHAEVNLAKRYLEVTLTNIFQDIDMLPTVNYNVNALPMRRIGQH